MPQDLSAAALAVQTGQARASELIEAAVCCADAAASRHAYVERFDAGARATTQAIDALRGAGLPLPPLAGLAVSVKDLFEVAGQRTGAGSTILTDVARQDCPAVARLRRAGAALTGHTNMTEFAFSGVGINPHFGTPANPVTAVLDATPRIPGGSTSGGAVTVATGAAFAALGSDTGGSIRIPAALQGLVGFKNTARLTPAEGSVPLSTTLDTVCAITRSVRDAVLLHEVLADRRVRLSHRPLSAWRLASPARPFFDGIDATTARGIEQALATLRAAGARIDEIELPELAELERIGALGGIAPVEAWAWHRALLAAHEAAYDPRVAARIRRAAGVGAADYIEMLQVRRHVIAKVEAAVRGYDALLSPTVPVIAPPLQALIDSDEAFFAANALLLRNPSVVNTLDGCATSLPCQRPGEWPVGLMVWAPALRDDTVLDVSLAIETCLQAASR